MNAADAAEPRATNAAPAAEPRLGMHAAEIWVDDHYVPGKDDEPPESIEAEVRADAEWVAKAAEEVRALTGGRPPPDPGPSFGGTAPIQPLPEVRVRGGTPFELGQQVGERMRLFIADSFETDRRLKQLITHCEGTEEGRKLLRDFEEANRAAYPAVLEEIDGIVAGSGLSQTAVLIANFRQEIVAFVPETDPIVGCTDLHVAAPWCAAWGHSEDATSPAIDELPLGYIVHSTLLDDDETTILHHYTAFAYPGCVCGWAWGFNSHGVVCSINALTPAKLQVGLAASVVSRDVLNATGLDDARRRATVGGHGGGQRFNIGSTHEPHKRLLVETSPSGCIVKELVGNDGCDESDWTAPPAESVFCGCNVYLFGDVGALEGRTAQFSESSRRRLLRAQQLIRGLGADLDSGASLAWILKVLSDRTDEQYPLHRTLRQPDYGRTDHVVLFDVLCRKAYVYRGATLPSDANDGPRACGPAQEYDLPPWQSGCHPGDPFTLKQARGF